MSISYKLALMAALPLLKFLAKSTENQLDDEIILVVSKALDGTLAIADLYSLIKAFGDKFSQKSEV